MSERVPISVNKRIKKLRKANDLGEFSDHGNVRLLIDEVNELRAEVKQLRQFEEFMYISIGRLEKELMVRNNPGAFSPTPESATTSGDDTAPVVAGTSNAMCVETKADTAPVAPNPVK